MNMRVEESAAQFNCSFGSTLFILGCSDDGGCSHGEPNCNVNERRCFRCQNSGDCLVHRNKFCRNGRCRQSEMNIQITTVLVEPCFSGCTNDQDCQENQICGPNGRCRAGEMHLLLRELGRKK